MPTAGTSTADATETSAGGRRSLTMGVRSAGGLRHGAMLRAALAALAGLILPAALPSLPASAGHAPVAVPAARVGDAWTVVSDGLTWDLRATEMGAAVGALGQERQALLVDVAGPHPITGELKEVTRHTIAVDAASATAIADVTAWEFAGDSEPGAYASYEPNNPDGWPGWVLAGGLLTGRTLAAGDVVRVPLVMTGTSGATTIELRVGAAETGSWGRCAPVAGSLRYPEYLTWDGSRYQSVPLEVDVDTTVCEGSPYAARTRVEFTTDSATWETVVDLRTMTRGSGAAVVAGPFVPPPRHLTAVSAPFAGVLRDGGPLPVWSVEEAQAAADGAPGLRAWRVLHPGGYLVEAHFAGPGDAGALAEAAADQWRLTYAAPGGAQHTVLVQRRQVPVAVDQPEAGDYPHPVPALASWPEEILTAAGAVAAWQQHSGFAAVATALRWEPLRNARWHVTGSVAGSCGEGCAATVGMEMPYRFDTGAAQTGEHPMPPGPAAPSRSPAWAPPAADRG